MNGLLLSSNLFSSPIQPEVVQTWIPSCRMAGRISHNNTEMDLCSKELCCPVQKWTSVVKHSLVQDRHGLLKSRIRGHNRNGLL